MDSVVLQPTPHLAPVLPPRSVRLRVFGAHDLPASRRWYTNSPDPFATIELDSEEIDKTEVVRGTSRPFWNKVVDINVHRSSVICVKVFDNRSLGDPELLGFVNINLADIDLEQGAIDTNVILKRSNKNPTPCGSLRISLSINVGQPVPNWSFQAPYTNFVKPSGFISDPWASYPPHQHQTSTSPVSTFAPTPAGRTSPYNIPHPLGSTLSPAANLVEQPIGRLSGEIDRLSSPPKQLPLVIQMIRSGARMADITSSITRDDAQISIDELYMTMDAPDLLQEARQRHRQVLYNMCGHYGFLPRAMQVSASYEPSHGPLTGGGFGDVYEGVCGGRKVAVKVIRARSAGDMERKGIVRKFCKEAVTWKALRHQNILPLTGVMTSGPNELAMISDWMENGNINEFINKFPDANQIALLSGAAKGVIYIHNQSLAHGDLKGANILIDQFRNARIADFGMAANLSDPAYGLSSSSNEIGGTVRWMSPELIDPKRFGFEKNMRTKASDCYAFAMVIYEVISGHIPFPKDNKYAVPAKVLDGKRPEREARFPDVIWDMLEFCWVDRPHDRPSVGDVLRCLEDAPDPVQAQ